MGGRPRLTQRLPTNIIMMASPEKMRILPAQSVNLFLDEISIKINPNIHNTADMEANIGKFVQLIFLHLDS